VVYRCIFRKGSTWNLCCALGDDAAAVAAIGEDIDGRVYGGGGDGIIVSSRGECVVLVGIVFWTDPKFRQMSGGCCCGSSG